MVRPVRWTSAARRDLAGIVTYISVDSRQYAGAVYSRIVAVADTLGLYPLSMRVVPEFKRPDIRESLSGNYRIIYQVQETFILVLAIVHSARDLSRFRKISNN